MRPVFVTQTVNLWALPLEIGASKKPDDTMLAVEKFVKENGPEALEKLIGKVDYLMTK